MSVSAHYYTFPTKKIVDIVKNSDDMVEDIINILGIGYNLTESEEDDEKYQYAKDLLYEKVPEYFQKTRIDINGLRLIANEITDHYMWLEDSFYHPLTTRDKGYFNTEFTRYGDDLTLFLAIAHNFYKARKFPFKIEGVFIENTSGYEQIIMNSEFKDKLFDETIIDFANKQYKVNLEIDKFTIPTILNVFQLAIEREEDIIYGFS